MDFQVAKDGFRPFLKVGTICYFKNPYFASNDSHPHVCVSISDTDAIFMICGTSQFATKLKHFDFNGLAYETLVRIKPGSDNSLTKDTYIDCNDPEQHNLNDLHQLFNANQLSLYGEVTSAELLQIKTGIETSDLIEGDTKTLILQQFPEIE